MFGKEKKHLIEVTQLSSLIAEDVEITGDILFTAGLRIDGALKGNAIGKPAKEKKGQSLLVLSDKGRIDGSVRCYDAVINGTVVGDLDVEHFLELQPKARVSGVIRYSALQMEVGASVEGQLVKRTDSEKPEIKNGADTAKVVEFDSEKNRNAG